MLVSSFKTKKYRYWFTQAKPNLCPHYDREEINLVLDGKTPPVLRCKNCGEII